MNPLPAHRSGPRLWLVTTLVLTGSLYLLYLLSTIGLMLAMRHQPHALSMTASHELPQSDFAIFWSAGKLLAMRSAARFGLHLPLSAWYRQTFPLDLLSAGAPFTLAWPYPPPMGLLVMPFSIIPLASSFWIWRIFSLAAATLLLRRAGLAWFPILAGLLSPAGLHDLLGGQNGTLTGAMLVSSLLLIARDPSPGAGIGGSLAGLLIIKPQLALAFPFVLLHKHRAKPLAWCLATAAAISLAATFVEGWQSWVFFFNFAQPDSLRAANQPFTGAFPAAGVTVFTLLRSLHAGTTVAWAGQAFAAAVACSLTWRLWRRHGIDPLRRMAVTVCLLILAMPHGFAYDLVGFSIVMAALAIGTTGWRRLAFALFWLFGGYTITLANITGLLLMPVVAGLAAWLTWETGAAGGQGSNLDPLGPPARGRALDRVKPAPQASPRPLNFRSSPP